MNLSTVFGILGLPSLTSSFSLSVWAFRTNRLMRRFMIFCGFDSLRIRADLMPMMREPKSIACLMSEISSYLVSAWVFDRISHCIFVLSEAQSIPVELTKKIIISKMWLKCNHISLCKTISELGDRAIQIPTLGREFGVSMSCWLP